MALLARNPLADGASRVALAYHDLRERAEYLTDAAVCRTFIRSELSPPSPRFEQIQAEYDTACRYGHALVANLPAAPPATLAAIRWLSRPRLTEPQLLETLAFFDRSIADYNRERKALDTLRHESENGENDITLAIISPLLIMLALALRITKVTGEILLDRKDQAG